MTNIQPLIGQTDQATFKAIACHECLIMKLQYIIQIENQDNYPFDGVKASSANVKVRTSLQSTRESHHQAFSKIHALLNIKSSLLMQVLRVSETKGKKFQVDFQYVEEPLKNSLKMNEPSFVSILNEALRQFCKQLVINNIKYQLRFDSMGMSEAGGIKIYLGLNFQVVPAAEQQNLEEQYQIMLQKFMESHFNFRETVKSPSDHTFLSDYSHRINKKLTEFEDRLNKMRKYSKQTIISNPSCKNEEKNESKSNMFLDLINSKKPVRQNTVATGLTSNSLIHHKNNVEPAKPHKFSFADYTTQSQKLDDSSSKQSSLTKRINSALEKTEVAFKVYERYSRKKQRRKS